MEKRKCFQFWLQDALILTVPIFVVIGQFSSYDIHLLKLIWHLQKIHKKVDNIFFNTTKRFPALWTSGVYSMFRWNYRHWDLSIYFLNKSYECHYNYSTVICGRVAYDQGHDSLVPSLDITKNLIFALRVSSTVHPVAIKFHPFNLVLVF